MDDGDLKILHEGRLLTPGEFDAELHSELQEGTNHPNWGPKSQRMTSYLSVGSGFTKYEVIYVIDPR